MKNLERRFNKLAGSDWFTESLQKKSIQDTIDNANRKMRLLEMAETHNQDYIDGFLEGITYQKTEGGLL